MGDGRDKEGEGERGIGERLEWAKDYNSEAERQRRWATANLSDQAPVKLGARAGKLR